MRQKSKPLPEWQTQSADDQSTKEREAREAEDRRKKKEEDDAAYSFLVYDEDNVLVSELKYEQAAVKLARDINGKAIWAIEKCGLKQVYPPTTPKHD